MTGNLETLTPAKTQPPGEWASHAASESWGSSVLNFAERNWKEIAGVGVLVGAGALFVASRGANLGMLTNMLKGGETAAGVGEAGIAGAGVSENIAARLRDVDHFVFDMDRTLVDHDKALAALTQTMSKGLVSETGLSREFIDGALAQTTERLHSPFFFRNLNEIQPLKELDVYRGVDLNERFAGVSKSAEEAFNAALQPKPETIDLLNYLHSEGKTVSVFTAGNPARALTKLNGAGLLKNVDNLYTSGLNAFEDSAASGLLQQDTALTRVVPLAVDAKSTGAGYEAIAQDLASTPRKLAMTGDHPIEDIVNAKRLGYFASQAKWYRATPAADILPDLELYNPSDLTSVLKSIGH